MEFSHSAQMTDARRAVVEICALMHQRQLLAARDGNVSVRIGERRLLVTPTAARKGFLAPKDLVVCDLDGKPVRGERGRPSSELGMHLAIYQERSDVRAVVHAHPPCAVAHTVAGISMAEPLMPEVFCELGEVATIPYTTPGTAEVADGLREPIRIRDALLMERHGSITVGATLAAAYDRLEILEHAARISLMARALAPSGVEPLADDKLQVLRRLYGCGLP